MAEKDTKEKKIDPEEAILEIINFFGFIRRNKLYQMLKRGVITKKEIPLESYETSYSQPFVVNSDEIAYNKKEINIEPIEINLVKFNRILKRLIHLKILKNLKYPSYVKLGIYDKDKKASYITSYQIFEMIEHYDSVLEQVEDKDPLKRKYALIEIESMMKGVVYTPEQLMKLSNILSKIKLEDPIDDPQEAIIRILHHSIFDKRIFPANLEKFQEDLIKFYKSNRIMKNTKAALLSILGLLGNKIVIEFLEKDILDKGMSIDYFINAGYTSWALSEIITQSTKELFRFQNTLNEDQSKILFQIRQKAQDNIPNYESVISYYKEGLNRSKR